MMYGASAPRLDPRDPGPIPTEPQMRDPGPPPYVEPYSAEAIRELLRQSANSMDRYSELRPMAQAIRREFEEDAGV